MECPVEKAALACILLFIQLKSYTYVPPTVVKVIHMEDTVPILKFFKTSKLNHDNTI